MIRNSVPLLLVCLLSHIISTLLICFLPIKFEEAYEKGNRETSERFAESFQSMGQETYMQYMNEIKEIHAKEYEESKGIIGPLKTKLSVPAPDPHSRACAPEEKDLMKCMESKSIVDCKSFSDHYSLCVQQSLKS